MESWEITAESRNPGWRSPSQDRHGQAKIGGTTQALGQIPHPGCRPLR